ncbi:MULTISPECIES: hydrogen peroxide-inducible genes activator [Oceanibaculum]|uniref:LysR family hydrogen peroxide-inducible transcriptional activator n=1 Tax=Oceanibaculum indicum TaxID=526216 RepID=A0A420WQR9_9PROT|nr:MULTISPECIES: hydrogen peroxide-inducible genes activator [Oceanibaculum]MCH2393870.1 hydrogen peroxide-inducible genes activator [Oceanibaculum sp.]RKQ73397.1 LysR family hydrogen peroxide-inducible transcriptional activator [Oceanibaculum indicum]
MTPLPTLKQLRYLVALAEHHHFGKAAEACFVTQSTLSAGIQELETLLGTVLVDRGNRSVIFTPVGEAVLQRARKLLSDAEELVEEAAAGRQPLSGRLRMGVIPTVGPFLLPRILPALREAYPALKLYLTEDRTERLVEQLKEGALDILLLALPYDIGDVETITLAGDSFYFCCLPEHPLAQRNLVPVEALKGENLLLLEDGHCLRDHALSACRLEGARNSQGFRATSLHTLVQMVDNGLGVTLLPKLALDGKLLDGTRLVARPMDDPEATREIGLVWRRGTARREEFQLLADFLKAQMAALST